MRSTSELRQLMLPWVGVLRDRVDLGPWNEEWQAGNGDVVWLLISRVSPSDDDARVFDGLELLTLLGQIDLVAWRMALGSAWARHASAWIEAAHGRAIPFGLRISYRTNDLGVGIGQWGDRLAVKNISSTRSREYIRARFVLEQEYAKLEEPTANKNLKPVARTKLRSPIHLDSSAGSMELALLQLLQVTSLQHVRTCASTCPSVQPNWSPLLTITQVSTRGGDMSMSERALVYATELVELGIALENLSLRGLRVTPDTGRLFVSSLQCLLATIEPDGMNQRQVVPVCEVFVSQTTHRQTIAAIFSALAFSSATSTVTIDWTPSQSGAGDDIDYVWMWIALVLFSKQVPNPIDEATIDVSTLTARNVAAMNSLIRDDDQVQLVGEDSLVKDCVLGRLSSKHYACAAKLRLITAQTA